MSSKVLKNAAHFTFNELRNRFFSWVGLAVIQCIVVFLLGGLLGLALAFPVVLAFGNICNTNFLKLLQYTGISLDTFGLLKSSWLFKFVLIAVTLIISYLIIYQMISFSLVVVRNALDALEGKKLRMMKNRVKSHSLIFACFLFIIAVVTGFVCLIIPGLYLFYKLYFTCFVIADKQCDILAAFNKSYKITLGHIKVFLGIVLLSLVEYFIRMVVQKFIGFNIGIALSIAAMFIPVMPLFVTSVYYQLKQKHELEQK